MAMEAAMMRDVCGPADSGSSKDRDRDRDRDGGSRRDRDGTPGLISGELYFRSNTTAASAVLPPGIAKWLSESAPSEVGGRGE